MIVGGEDFITNGKVTSAAGIFECWMGRNIHVQGKIDLFDEITGAPLRFVSDFRLN